MWNFVSNVITGSLTGQRKAFTEPCSSSTNCCEDDASSSGSREEGLECPICWESFNIVENVPYVLWCGHTLCKNCVMGLQRAVFKFPSFLFQLPLFISCPWCHLLSPRILYKGNLRFPRKNYFLLWMVESKNDNGPKSHSSIHEDHQVSLSGSGSAIGNQVQRHQRRVSFVHSEQSPVNSHNAGLTASYLNMGRISASLRKSLSLVVNLTAKFPLVIMFLVIVVYAIPASAVILLLYIVVTILFALPSLLILYCAYPSLDWLVREIIT